MKLRRRGDCPGGPNGRNIVYVREPEGSLAARAYPDEFTGEIYYFDALGSTVVMTDMQGNVTDTYAYDAWGEVEHLSGSTADNPYLYVGELGYYDHWQAPALADMLHLGVRFYEPELGRFGQREYHPSGGLSPADQNLSRASSFRNAMSYRAISDLSIHAYALDSLFSRTSPSATHRK